MREKNTVSKKLKFAEIKFRDKSENKISRKEELIPATFSSFEVAPLLFICTISDAGSVMSASRYELKVYLDLK